MMKGRVGPVDQDIEQLVQQFDPQLLESSQSCKCRVRYWTPQVEPGVCSLLVSDFEFEASMIAND